MKRAERRKQYKKNKRRRLAEESEIDEHQRAVKFVQTCATECGTASFIKTLKEMQVVEEKEVAEVVERPVQSAWVGEVGDLDAVPTSTTNTPSMTTKVSEGDRIFFFLTPRKNNIEV
eukprot:TRINITY_DN5572_c0_g2_i10.p1 TRINITY_DN5572_c0_g2~~TRINITY_DN5572_c0_g2_i10.p1  ORF type:complete len:117 (-),score=29.01 TRINITY_DN5572_c0_g2_i10:639-989(-)